MNQVLRKIKTGVLRGLARSGAMDAALSSAWRRSRLLILCYHGVSLTDEHLWNPELYVSAELLRARMRLLRDARCNVLPLDAAVAGLRASSLPPRAVAITFDDGMFDFRERAWPVLREFGFPATVYQTTYYTDFNRPIPRLTCSYLLWKARAGKLCLPEVEGLEEPAALAERDSRERILKLLDAHMAKHTLSGAGKDELAARVAGALGFDYDPFRKTRVLHCMTADEVAAVARDGADVQLHTHRHRTPFNREAFLREIDDNAERLRAWTGREPRHFCYPAGVYAREFLPWLRERRIASATTCDPGICTAGLDPLTYPRYVDTTIGSSANFMAWVSGVASMIPQRNAHGPLRKAASAPIQVTHRS